MCIYDSLRRSSVEQELKEGVCSYVQPSVDVLTFDLIDVDTQPNSCDCGLFALAYATELAFGYEPALCSFKQLQMRKHLTHCLEVGKMMRFPSSSKRSRLGMRVRKSVTVKIYCLCRMPNNINLDAVLAENGFTTNVLVYHKKSVTP